MKKIRELATKALNGIQDVVADPKMARVTAIASGLVDVAAKISVAKISGPLGAAGLVLGTIEQVRNSLGVEPVDPVNEYFSKCGLRSVNSSLPTMLVAMGALDILNLEIFARNKDGTMAVGQKDGDQHFAFRVVAANAGKLYGDTHLWRSEQLDLSKISQQLWAATGQRQAKLIVKENGYCTILPLEGTDPPYVGIHDPAEFAQTIETYHARGISRSTLLIGPPGSGKTSFTRAYAKLTNKTLLVIPPDILAGNGRNDIELFANVFQPDILLFDDIDRAPAGLPYCMTLVDDLRRSYPKMVIISTCNRITDENTALLRPGRLGERREFLAPDRADRISVLRLYLNRYGVDASQYDLDALADAMTHRNFTHDYVRFIAEQAVVLGQERLMAYVLGTNTWLEELAKYEQFNERLMGRPSTQPTQPSAFPPISKHLR